MESKNDLTWELTLVAGAMIAALVAAIAIPNFLNAMHRGRQKRTMADLRQIGAALEDYHLQNKLYPLGKSALSEINTELSWYLPVIPESDGWDNEYLYRSNGFSYTLLSTGKDRKLDDLSIYKGVTLKFSNDLAFSNGTFISFPEIIE